MATENKSKTFRVAVTQAEPEWLNLQGSVEKTCKLIKEAAGNGAQLVSFPECWVNGYPAWIWTRPVDFDLGARYIEQSLSVDSDEMKAICDCARENKITVALGFSERHHDSLYISQATISDAGEILMKRRKIMPTHMERTVFGNSSGSSLDNVVDTPVGRVGQLACWEHIQPLLKYHTISQRETIHVAAWPPVPPYAGTQELWSMSREGTRSLSQTYAIEAGAFVLHTTSVITGKGIEVMGTASGALMNSPGGGSSAIFGPDGRQISQDLEQAQEGIIYADLDTREIAKSKSFVDIVGRKFTATEPFDGSQLLTRGVTDYSRPDLLWLGVDGKEKVHVRVDTGL